MHETKWNYVSGIEVFSGWSITPSRVIRTNTTGWNANKYSTTSVTLSCLRLLTSGLVGMAASKPLA